MASTVASNSVEGGSHYSSGCHLNSNVSPTNKQQLPVVYVTRSETFSACHRLHRSPFSFSQATCDRTGTCVWRHRNVCSSSATY